MKNAIKVSLVFGVVLLICSLTPVVSAEERSEGYVLPFPEGASYKLLQGALGATPGMPSLPMILRCPLAAGL